MASKRREAGTLESEVLAALWAAGRPLTPAEAAESIHAGLACTTALTILTRLHAKGAVACEPAGRAQASVPVLDEPSAATWLLALGGFLTSATPGATLCLIGFTLIGPDPPLLAAQSHWSAPVLRRQDPVAPPVAAVAVITAITAITLLARVTTTSLRRAQAVRTASLALPSRGGELAVIDTSGVAVYAVPGRPGLIVTTTGLLRRLDGAERRALLAHGRAYLPGQHHAGTGTRLPLPAVALPGLEDLLTSIETLRAPAPSDNPWRIAILASLVACAGRTLAAVLESVLPELMAVLGQLEESLGVFHRYLSERSDRDQGTLAVLGVVELRQRRLRAGLRRLGQGAQHVGHLVEPAALIAGVGEHLPQRLPEPQRAVADREDRCPHPAPLARPQ